jgi:hypothetical protein
MIPKAKSTIQRRTCKRQEGSQKGSEEGSKCQQSQMLGLQRSKATGSIKSECLNDVYKGWKLRISCIPQDKYKESHHTNANRYSSQDGNNPMSLGFRGPAVPEHPDGNKWSEEHHHSHPILGFSYTAILLGEMIHHSIICCTDQDEAHKEANSGAQVS